MNRRRLLLLATSGAGATLAGCSSENDEPNIKDSDGDGVIDSEDYAPQDPEVQKKSDIKTTATITPTRTPSPTPSPTPTATPSPTPLPSENQLSVASEYWSDQSRITAYSNNTVEVSVHPEVPNTEADRPRVYAGLYEFPRDTVLAETVSQPIERADTPTTVELFFDNIELDPDTGYHLFVAFIPESGTVEEVSNEEVTTIMETDRFKLADNGRDIVRSPYSNELDDDSGDRHERKNVEGAYDLTVSGRTDGQSWDIIFFGWKSAHAIGFNRARGRSRSEYVSYELTDGSATELAKLLNDEADSRGFSERTKIEFIIDFVQALPYVSDDVSRDFDDYTKFIIETLPELSGDCEDTAILLAAVLSADTFGYDMILIQPPGHMAVGIYETDPQGYYWELDGRKYSYIETTGAGWGIGDLPDEYVDTDAYLY